MMKKFLAVVIACAAVLACAFSACAEEARDAYLEIGMDATLEYLTEKYGEPEVCDDMLVFSEGFACIFYKNGALQVKSRLFSDVRELASLAEGDIISSSRGFKQGELLEVVESAMGVSGTELMRINITDEENPGVRLVLAWQDKTGSALEMLFESEGDEWRLFYVVSVENNMNGDANK